MDYIDDTGRSTCADKGGNNPRIQSGILLKETKPDTVCMQENNYHECTCRKKILMLEHSNFTREEYIWLVSNITVCFDYHIREISEILLISHGINEDGAATLIKSLEEMKNHVTTRYVTNEER